MWLIKVHTSQEAPTSTSGSSSPFFVHKIRIEIKKWKKILDEIVRIALISVFFIIYSI